MVRLSDIFRSKPTKKDSPSLPEKVLQKERKRLSETQIIKIPKSEGLPAPASSNRFRPETKAHFKSLSEKSRDIQDRVEKNLGITP